MAINYSSQKAVLQIVKLIIIAHEQIFYGLKLILLQSYQC